MKKNILLFLLVITCSKILAQDCTPTITSPRLGEAFDFAPDIVVMCSETDTELLTASSGFESYQWLRKSFNGGPDFEPVRGAISSTLLVTAGDDIYYYYKVVVTQGACTEESNVVLIDGYAVSFPTMLAEWEPNSFEQQPDDSFNVCNGSIVRFSNIITEYDGPYTWFNALPSAIPPDANDPAIIRGETENLLIVNSNGNYGFYCCTTYCPNVCEYLGYGYHIQVNFGDWDFCSLSTNDPELKVELSLYPNPTVDLLLLGGKNVGVDIFSEIQIFDMTGRKVKTIVNHDTKSPINVSELSSGAYLIIAKDNYDKVFKSRFLRK